MDLQSLYNHLIATNTRLLGNMYFPFSPGHMIWELDNFLRMRFLGEVSKDCKYYGVFNDTPINMPQHIAYIYPHLFNDQVRFVVNNELHRSVDILHALNPDLFADCGLSHFKGFISSAEDRGESRLIHMPSHGMPLMWVLSHQLNYRKTLEYYERRSLSASYNPLADIPPLSPQLEHLLNNSIDKIALVHIRTLERNNGSAGNAGTRSDPMTLVDTIKFLCDSGYKIVKVGMEPYPPEWKRFGVVNYTNSELRNFANDLLLIKASKVILVNASGFQNLPDILSKPMVVYGTWPIAAMAPSRASVHVPTFLRSNKNGRLLKFCEQINNSFSRFQYWEKGDCLSFPDFEYSTRMPQADEILAATQEAIALGEKFIPRSELQNKFNDLSSDYYFKNIEGRISQFFLERFSEALETGF